jgi:hypothetical protein
VPKSIFKTASAYKVEIFIGGDYEKALDICQVCCDTIGLCVTVEPTTYIYTNGRCEGVRVGLINYARYPKPRLEILEIAEMLATRLLRELHQGSYTIQDDTTSMFYSERKEDGCDGI